MTQNRRQADKPLADDLIWGVDGDNGIAAFVGLEVRKARHLIDSGAIPVKRLGHRTIVGSRSEIRRAFGRQSD